MTDADEARARITHDMEKKAAKERVAALKNDNLFWRTHAQRLLVERGELDVAPA